MHLTESKGKINSKNFFKEKQILDAIFSIRGGFAKQTCQMPFHSCREQVAI
jgi:hypothetical protein